MKKMKVLPVLLVFLLSGHIALFAEPILRLLSWNVESGGNSPAVIARQLTGFEGYDLITLVEVDDKNRDSYTGAFGTGYGSVLSESGSRFNDHILVLYDTSRLELLEARELHEYKGVVITPSVTRGGKRSPVILHLRDRLTGLVFYHVSVHFSRTNDAQRKLQALVLRDWILERQEPVLAAGDFNFDYSFGEKPGGNDAYRLFTYYPGIEWIAPEVLVDTNYSESNGRETYPDSILDFIFAANTAAQWDIRSRIIVRPGDFPDTEETSDHRPVMAEVFF